jgi:hypothetical protein
MKFNLSKTDKFANITKVVLFVSKGNGTKSVGWSSILQTRCYLNKRKGRALALVPFILLALAVDVEANDISYFQTFYNTDVAVAGLGGMRNTGKGVITLGGISGRVKRAYLYWHGPTSSSRPNANASVRVNNKPVTGVNIGFSGDNCWDYTNSQAYRADVTSLVSNTGNGSYRLTGFGSKTVNTNGVSLIVFFDDGNPNNNRDIVLFDGNDSNSSNPYDSDGWNLSLSGINHSEGAAWLQLHVADGQFGNDFIEEAIILNFKTLMPVGQIFDGRSVPSVNMGPKGNGSLWDIRSFTITSFLQQGLNTVSLTMGNAGDCLSLVVGVVNLPAGDAPRSHGWMEVLMDTTTLLAIYALLAFLVERLTNGVSVLLSYGNWWRNRFDLTTAEDPVRGSEIDRNRRVALFLIGAILAVAGTILMKLGLITQIGVKGLPPIADQFLTGLVIASGGDPIREFIQRRERRRDAPQPSTPLQVSGTLVLQKSASDEKDRDKPE